MARLVRYKRIGADRHAVRLRSRCCRSRSSPAQLTLAALALLLLVTGIGIGTVLPITTVSVQNAVLPWQLGTVTGLINFMRALASALMVALYGAFLFGGAGAKGMTLESLAAAGQHAAPEGHFRWIFAAAAPASRSRGCCCSRWRSARCAPGRCATANRRLGAGGVGPIFGTLLDRKPVLARILCRPRWNLE